MEISLYWVGQYEEPGRHRRKWDWFFEHDLAPIFRKYLFGGGERVCTLICVVLVMMGMNKGAVVWALSVLPPRSQPQPQLPMHHPSGGAQPFDPTTQYADGPQPPSHSAVPHGHSANASDGHHESATQVPETRVAPEPPYQETHPQERAVAPQHRDGYEYDDLNENGYKRIGTNGFAPAQGRSEWSSV